MGIIDYEISIPEIVDVEKVGGAGAHRLRPSVLELSPSFAIPRLLNPPGSPG
jgi:hypothetical protein